MDKKSIHLGDIGRILFGDAPPIFLLEVFIRTLITYVFLLIATRWLGKRMTGQLSVTEMAVMLTLGAIVSVAMQVPESGVLMAVAVLLCTLAFERGVNLLDFKNQTMERLVQGDISILVVDGVIQHREMKKTRISNQQLLADLRSKGIYNLGLVRRVYLEASGIFSIYKSKQERPGLATLPPDDENELKRQNSVELLVCKHCGFVEKPDEQSPCKECGHDEWANAIMSEGGGA